MIEDRNLPVGARLVADYRKMRFVCVVEEGEDGKLAFALEGKRYSSPSAVGSAVMGGTACNGWRFWSLEGDAKPAPAGEKPARQAKPPSRKQIYKAPNQQNLAPGKTRWFCAACLKSFVTDGDVPPEVCPEGHRREDEATAPTQASKGRRTKKAATQMFAPHANQEDVPEGQVRYWCHGCMDAFLAFAGQVPEQCPNGHRNDDPELGGEAPVDAEVAS